MSKLLEPFLKTNELTPALNLDKPRYSQARVEGGLTAALLVKTPLRISKSDNLVKIGNKTIDVAPKSILELCEVLHLNGIDVSYIGDDSVLQLPSILLTNTDTEEYATHKLTTAPFEIDRLDTMNTSSITPIQTEVQVLSLFETNTLAKVPFNILNNKAFYKPSVSGVSACYKVTTNLFIWHVKTEAVVTANKYTISRHIGLK